MLFENKIMKLTKIYCGSNNATGILEIDTIKAVLNRTQASYTIIEAMGIWKGKQENTAIIEIYGDYNLAIPLELKRELMQDSVLVVESLVEVNFI
jgi:hypothetical protein